MQQWIEAQWKTKTPSWYLRILSIGYQWITALRSTLYRLKLLPSYRSNKPVIVIGNITVGGTGKTPLVIYLCDHFKRQGLTPLVISRGYGGNASRYPWLVDQTTAATTCGDEPLLIALKTGCQVVVDPKRVRAVKWAEQHLEYDVIILDDGLQHLALQRDIECVVVDGQRGFSNGYHLPAGPLREPVSRLESADYVVCNSGECDQPSISMTLKPVSFTSLTGEVLSIEQQSFTTVHAVAGIGNPTRFFTTLRRLGLTVIEHEFPDHHPFDRSDLPWTDHPIIMTAKDVVKCQHFELNHVWYLDVNAELSEDLAENMMRQLHEATSLKEAQ